MTPHEALRLAETMRAAGNGMQLYALVDGERIMFMGGRWGTNSLPIRTATVDWALLHWRAYVTRHEIAPPPIAPPEPQITVDSVVRFYVWGQWRLGSVERLAPPRALISYRLVWQPGRMITARAWRHLGDVRLVHP